jgi:hypothetical protein
MGLFKDEVQVPEGVSTELVAKVESEIDRITETAKSVVVHDKASYDSAANIALECARREKRIDEVFADIEESSKKAKASADKARSTVLEFIRKMKAPFTEAKRIIDGKAETWRKAENERLASEAEKKRREEQARLDHEKAEKEAELKRQAEEKRKEAEALKRAGDEKAAKEAERQSQLAEAAAKETAAAPVVADVKKDVVDAPKGTTHRANWKAVCHDFPALVKAIAEGRAPIDLIEFNQSVADGYARAQKDAMHYAGMIAKDVGITSHKV